MPTWTKEQNEAIYKSGNNIIVSAGAGSGKTAVLTTRVLHKLESGIHINELLILTFTKAAAAEMKQRIRKKIKEHPNLIHELSLLDASYVTTFDSFALSIVKKYHYLLNVSKNINITDETLIEMLRKDVLREVLDEFYEKKDLKFLNMINDFCVKDDNELYEAILKTSKILENSFESLHLLNGYINNYLSQNQIEKYIQEYEQLVLEKRDILKEKLEEFTLIAPKEYISKIYENLNTLLNSKDLDTLFSVKSSKLPSLPRNLEEEIKYAKEDLNASLKEFINLLEYGNKETLKKDLKKMTEYAEIMSQILMEYFKKLNIQKSQRKYYDFNDIAFLALNLLKNNKEVCEEIKNSFKEIMIDEYQDTNDIQEAFIKLISDHNVYMVGDIKQSIYRFRNANPYLFKEKYDNYRLGINGEKIDLLKNFRSRKEVLQNINQIFNLIMDDFLGGANYLEEHQMVFGNNDYLLKGTTKENYHMDLMTYEYKKEYGYTKEEIEIFMIGQDIKKKIEEGYLLYDKDESTVHKASYKDFVILMDRSTTFELYKKIFNYLKIPISLYKDETFNDSTCFIVVKNMIKVLVAYAHKNFDQQFKISFVSVARSFLMEYKDQEIYDILKNSNWYDNRLYKTIKPILIDFSTKPITQIIKEIYCETKIYEKILKIADIKENMTILKYIQNIAHSCKQEGYNIEELYEFLERINQEEIQIKYSNEEQINDCVKIMTIHKSKGLEYPICYFSGLYKTFNISDMKEKFLFDKKYGIITPIKEEGLYSCFLKELVKHNYLLEEISEKIRLFYVAVTRAKEKMIVVLPKNLKTKPTNNLESRLKNRSLADFLYSIWENIKFAQIEQDMSKLFLTKDYLTYAQEQLKRTNSKDILNVQELTLKSVTIENKNFSKKNTNLNTKEDYENIKLGLKFHEYLEQIDFEKPNYNAIKELFIKKKIKKFLENELIQKYKTADIFKEYEFIYEENDQEFHGIIDLMIILNDQIIILDYKLNNLMDNDYIKQLRGYQKYIMYKSNKLVKIYLYSILSEEMIDVEESLIGL